MRMRSVKLYMAAFLVLLSFAVPGFSLRAAADGEKDGPQLYARSAVLMDADSGRVLFGKEEGVARPMASTTKIMTCILALEEGEMEQACTVSAGAAAQPQVRLGVREGERYRLADLLYSLMLESHNDSAVVIAEAVGGSVEEFAAMMNRKAEEIGCRDTCFLTPNGLDASDNGAVHSTTARDLALILRYCITESPCREDFLAITRTKDRSIADLDGTRSFFLVNHNVFLTMMEGALTGKTGFTADAGYCYVGALEDGGRTFIVALLACGWPDNRNYKWEDTKELMRYGMEHYHQKEVTLRIPLPDLPVKGGAPASGRLGEEASVRLEAVKSRVTLLLGEGEELVPEAELAKNAAAPVRQGEKMGQVVWTLDGQVMARQEVTAARDVEERTPGWCLCRIAERFFVYSAGSG